MYRFDELSVIVQSTLVFNFCGGDPRLDLVAQPLQFFNFLFEIRLVLLLLVVVGGIVYLLPDVFEGIDPFGDFLQAAVDFA